jgi:uncharacterized sulfatase
MLLRILFTVVLTYLLTSPALAAPPNVLFILGDDQGWRDYGFMGHEQIRTPNLDRLAKESLVYTRGYVPHSLCRPSLASIITGLYPHQHRIVGNNPPLPPGLASAPAPKLWMDERYRASWNGLIANLDRCARLPAILADGGYLTAQTGKWWEGSYQRGGFTRGMTHGDPARGGRHGDAGLAIGRPSVQQALDYMDEARQSGKPFFLWYAPILPHVPHNAPDKYAEAYRGKAASIAVEKYWANCTWFDEGIGTLLDYLERHKLADNTLVVYLADNGWVQPVGGEGGAIGGPRGKRSPYDGGIRTPILFRWPGKIAPRMDRERLASSIDLVPTIVASCGLTVPRMEGKGLPGINLLDEQAAVGRDAVFGATFEHDIQSLEEPAASLQYRWIVSGPWKLIVPHAPRLPKEPVELFRIQEDPGEETNLAAKEAEVVARLRGRLEDWWPPASK